MEWLRFRLANMKLEERAARERSNTRRLGRLGTGDVMETHDDVTAAGDVTSASPVRHGDVIDSGDPGASKAGDAALACTGGSSAPSDVTHDVTTSGGGDVARAGDDVIPTRSDVTFSPRDVTSGSSSDAGADDDASALADASIASVRASPVPADVTLATDDVTVGPDDVTVGSDVSGGSSASSEEEEEEEEPELLRERCRRQRRQLRGLKRRLAQLERENAALRMRRDPAPEREAVPMDPAALVEDIKQAAAETAAQLAPSGLAFQPETGLYYDHDSGYYWDPAVQMYYDGSSGYYLRYDDASGSYQYVESAGEPSSAPGDSAEPASDGPTHRRRRTGSSSEGEELEEGEIEDEEEDEEEEAEEERHHWTGEEHWRRRREAATTAPPPEQCQRESATPAMVESGPRSPQASAAEPPWLRMIVTETKLEGVRLGSLHIATIDGLTVGRDSSQQLCLDDANLSKFHAVISYRCEPAVVGGGAYYIRDLGSRNGTLVDGRRISAAKQESEDTALPHGCQLRLGATCLVCHVHAAADTCLDCEPGQTQQRLAPTAAPPPPPPPAGDARQQRRLVANRIRQKYGLRAGDGAAVGSAPGYTDRAAERRRTKGSAHHSEKTQRADVRQKLPQKNKGFQLLQGMGWREGSGLGRQGQGIVEPVAVEERAERRGLGCHEPTPPAVGKKEKCKTEVWQKTQERFSKLV